MGARHVAAVLEQAKQLTALVDAKMPPEPKSGSLIWLRWGIDVETKQRVLLSIHSTLDKAIEALPEEYQSLSARYPAESPYVLNYLHEAIEKRVME